MWFKISRQALDDQNSTLFRSVLDYVQNGLDQFKRL